LTLSIVAASFSQDTISLSPKNFQSLSSSNLRIIHQFAHWQCWLVTILVNKARLFLSATFSVLHILLHGIQTLIEIPIVLVIFFYDQSLAQIYWQVSTISSCQAAHSVLSRPATSKVPIAPSPQLSQNIRLAESFNYLCT